MCVHIREHVRAVEGIPWQVVGRREVEEHCLILKFSLRTPAGKRFWILWKG